jgi:hypothetical protein
MSGTDGRRRLLRLAAAAAVLLLIVLVGPFGRNEPPEAASDTPTPTDRPTLTGPTRGFLAGNAAFVDAVRRLPWTDGPHGPELPNPPQEARWVAFAGDVAGGRWALIVSTPPPFEPGSGLLFARWFGGPPGAGPGELTTTTPPIGVPDGGPTGLLEQSTGTLVVVAAPGDGVEVSERPEIGPDGEPFRTYRAVDTRDGVAVVPLGAERTSGSAVSFRAVRDGRTHEPTTPWAVNDRGAGGPVQAAYPRGAPSAIAALAVDRAAEAMPTTLGLPAAATEVTALWTGNVPGPGPEAGEPVLVTVTVPSGAVLVDGEWLVPVESPSGDYIQGGDCGLDVLPAGPPADERVLAMACEVVDPHGRTPLRSYLVVAAPPEVTLVRVHDDDSRFLAEFVTTAGVVVAPLPRGTATVEAVTAGDISLGRTDLLARGVDFGG